MFALQITLSILLVILLVYVAAGGHSNNNIKSYMHKEIPGWRNKAWRICLFICPECHMGFTTVDMHDGVIPAGLRCINRMDGCVGRAISQGYSHERPIPPHIPEPTYEFYMPTHKELEALHATNFSVWEHCKQGGLAIRERDVSNDPKVFLKHVHHRVPAVPDAHHSSGVILEVRVQDVDNFNYESLGKGFWHYDTAGKMVIGPYHSIDAAVAARNEYFRQL